MNSPTSRRTVVAALGALVAGWHLGAQSRTDRSNIVIHGAGPTGVVARIAIQLNFQKPETWIYEISSRSVSQRSAYVLLQNGMHNARKYAGNGFVLLKKVDDPLELRTEFTQDGLVTLAGLPAGHYSAVIEIPPAKMKLGGKFKVSAEGLTNEAKLVVL
jgi:hypothetical protein